MSSTETLFKNATYIRWQVTSYSDNTPFKTYLIDEDIYKRANSSFEYGKEWSSGISSVGSAGFDGKNHKVLLFFNPSPCHIVTEFLVTDSYYFYGFLSYGPWSKLLTLTFTTLFGIFFVALVSKRMFDFYSKEARTVPIEEKPKTQ